MKRECIICGRRLKWWQDHVWKRGNTLSMHMDCAFFYLAEAIRLGLLPSPGEVASAQGNPDPCEGMKEL
jgi:hypothetical protein